MHTTPTSSPQPKAGSRSRLPVVASIDASKPSIKVSRLIMRGAGTTRGAPANSHE